MLPQWFLAHISDQNSLTEADSSPPNIPSKSACFLSKSSWDQVLAVLMCKVLSYDVGAFGSCVGSGRPVWQMKVLSTPSFRGERNRIALRGSGTVPYIPLIVVALKERSCISSRHACSTPPRVNDTLEGYTHRSRLRSGQFTARSLENGSG